MNDIAKTIICFTTLSVISHGNNNELFTIISLSADNVDMSFSIFTDINRVPD